MVRGFGKICSSLHTSSCPHTGCIIKTSSTDWKALCFTSNLEFLLLFLPPFSFLLSGILAFISVFAGLYLALSFYKLTFPGWPGSLYFRLWGYIWNKSKLWVWFGLRRAHWPRHVVFLGQTRERWGGEKNLCESSCVFEENPDHS